MKKEHTFVDTGLLRDHVSKLRQQKKIASRLYENVAAMKRLSDPSVAYQYNSILRDIQQMIDYFDRMAKELDHIGDEAVELSHRIGKIIEESTERTRSTTSKNFML